MQENIRISEKDEKVYLSEEMLSKIKNLIKGYNYLRKEEFDALSTDGINYYEFRNIIDSIARHFNVVSDVMLQENEASQFDADLENQVKNLCVQYLKMNPNKEDGRLLNIFRNKNNMAELEQIIDVVTQIKQTEEKMYLLRDLTNAKDDYIKDMQYFMNNEDIDKFNLEYSQAIKEKNTDKMRQMLRQIKQLILKERENYTGNIDTMNDENFCFVDHNISNSLDKRQFVAERKLENYKNRYRLLLKDQKVRKEKKDKYDLYFHIDLNKDWYSLLQNEFDDLEKRMIKDNTEESELINKKKQIENEINDLISSNNVMLLQSYKNSSEYNDIQNRINILKKQRDKLKLHPLLNFIKIRKINDELNNLRRNSKKNSEIFKNNKSNNIADRETKIKLLKSELQSIEEQLADNRKKKTSNQQELDNLNKKIFEYFKCNSIKEVSTKLREAKEFLENYDYSNEIILREIEATLQKTEQQIQGQETELQNIQEDRKIVSR